MIRIDAEVHVYVQDEEAYDTFENLVNTETGDGYVVLEFKGSPWIGPVVAVPSNATVDLMGDVQRYFEIKKQEAERDI